MTSHTPPAQMSEVAARAGVSRATVSRTLSSPHLVSESTRDRVMEAVHALGYTPNVNAQVLASRAWTEVGLLLRAPRNPTYGELYQCLQAACTKEDISMISMVPSAHDDDEAAVLRRVVGTRPDGLLIATGSLDLNLIETFAQGIPLVVVPRPVESPFIASASFDEVGNAKLIAEAVLANGHRRIAIATRPPKTSSVERLRTSTMARFLRSKGADVQILQYDAAPKAESFEDFDPCTDKRGRSLEAQMSPDRTVLMFANDVQAAIYIAHMRQKGECPGVDLSVTGLDGSEPWASALGLATVSVPVADAAEAAVKILADRLRNPTKQIDKIVFPGTLRLGTTLATL